MTTERDLYWKGRIDHAEATDRVLYVNEAEMNELREVMREPPPSFEEEVLMAGAIPGFFGTPVVVDADRRDLQVRHLEVGNG